MLHTTPSSPAVIEKWRAGIPTPERIAFVLKQLDQSDKSADEATDRRMENYYNCVDDYSWGGICDHASAQGKSERRLVRSCMNEILATGNPLKGSHDHYFLERLDGSFATDHCVKTRFGQAWRIKGEAGYESCTWVSVSKTKKTYEKKGFRLMKATYEFDYYMVSGEDGWRKASVVTAVNISPVEDVKYAYNYEFPLHLWIAKKKEEELATA